MKAIIASLLSLFSEVEASEGFTSNSDLPQVPFEVYFAEYDKTVHIVASCDKKRKDSVTLTFQSNDANVSGMVYATVNKAFDMPGVTRVQICRK